MSNNSDKLTNILNIERLNIVLKVSTLAAIVAGVWVVAQRSGTLDKIATEVSGIKTEIKEMNASVQKQAMDIAVLKSKVGVN